MRKGECEDSDDGQQQGSIVNVRFPDDDVDGSWITMIMIVVVLDVAAIMFMGIMKNEDADHHGGDEEFNDNLARADADGGGDKSQRHVNDHRCTQMTTSDGTGALEGNIWTAARRA